MKNTKSILAGLLSSALLLSLGACSTYDAAHTPAAETKVKTAPQVALTAEQISTKINKSGLATVKSLNAQTVGYDFKRSFMVPAQIGNYFGFSYTANQLANATETDNTISTLPVTIKVQHPEMLVNGKKVTESSWKDTLHFGRDNFVMWKFESQAELLNGEWSMSVLLQDKAIADKRFFVRVPPPMPAKVTEVCVAEVEKFPPPLQKQHTACCSNGDAEACYTFAYRGLEYIKDKHGAQLYYAKSCELGNISGCRLAAKLATGEPQKNVYLNKACDLKDTMSCIDVNRMP